MIALGEKSFDQIENSNMTIARTLRFIVAVYNLNETAS